jgi:hypothetical protein
MPESVVMSVSIPSKGVRPMRKVHAALTFAALLIMQPFAAFSQDAQIPLWLQDSLRRRSETLENIELYIKQSRVNIPGVQMALPDGAVGPCTGSICQAVKIEQTNIPGITIERPLSPMELAVLSGNTNAAFLDAFGQGMIFAQSQINQAIGGETDLFNLIGTVSASQQDGNMQTLINPTTMFATFGMMVVQAGNAAAEAQQSLATSNEQAQAEAEIWSAVLPRFASAGEANVGTLRTLVFSADNLGLPVQQVEGQEFDLSSASLFIDSESQAIVKQRFEGTASIEGQSRDIFIEVENSDFRNPPGCGEMYEPYRRTMRMGGMLDEEQMAQMEEARAQLVEFEQQLATMPAQQRQTMERMMGSQMDTMRSLINTGAFEYVDETEQIICNPDLASLFSIGNAPAVGFGNTPDVDDDLIRQIQEYLVILGYEPGNIDGVLDPLTQIAISQFQAEQGLPVSGEPSAELASLLANLVAA